MPRCHHRNLRRSRLGRIATGLAFTAIAGGGCHEGGLPEPSAPGPPTQLVITAQPTLTNRGQPIAPAVRVEIRDAAGNTVMGATDPVTLALGANPGSASLSGTMSVDAVDGVATFDDLVLDRSGAGYTFVATSGILSEATSSTFDVVFPFAQLSAGGFHTCGVTPDGEAYCWGDRGVPAGTTNSTIPVPVAGNLTFKFVSAGYYTCGLTSADQAYCWGSNTYGQLGDGTTSGSLTPVMVAGGHAFRAISTGNLHACALTIAGAAYCWGFNPYGELGDGTTVNRSVPVMVQGGLTFRTISASSSFTCGLTVSEEAYCWGGNFGGNLGDGSFSHRSAPVPVSGGRTYSSLSPGRDHACGVTTSGDTYCWGNNARGQLGNAVVGATNVPVPVHGGVRFTTVWAGGKHSCGLTIGGLAYCWGDNFAGNLGDGTTIERSSPTAVQGGLTFTTLTTGVNQHNCGIRLTGAAYCWGYNGNGQLGDGRATSNSLPTAVSDP